jgi:hypothetical protein
MQEVQDKVTSALKYIYIHIYVSLYIYVQEAQEKATSALMLAMWFADQFSPEDPFYPYTLSAQLFDPIRMVLGYQAG